MPSKDGALTALSTLNGLLSLNTTMKGINAQRKTIERLLGEYEALTNAGRRDFRLVLAGKEVVKSGGRG